MLKDSQLHNEKSKSADPTQWFHQRATSYVATQIIFHLNRQGVFKMLFSKETASVVEISEHLQLSKTILRTLLQYIAAVEDLIEEVKPDVYKLSSFGRKCVERFSRGTGQELSINFFDVRAGAYGPVWSSLDKLLKGEHYGETVHRNGEFAAEAVYKLAERFLPSLEENLQLSKAKCAIEWGVNSGLTESLARKHPHLKLGGVDRSEVEIERAQKNSPKNSVWVQSNILDTKKWTTFFKAEDKTLFFSLHLHEFLSAGEEAFKDVLKDLREKFKGSHLLFFEQPQLELSNREHTPEIVWLYAQSNVLIHHLIGNGKILPENKLIELLTSSGCRLVHVQDTKYLGYKAFLVEL